MYFLWVVVTFQYILFKHYRLEETGAEFQKKRHLIMLIFIGDKLTY